MSKIKIVIVEDEPDILEALEYNLARENFDVICATNGIDGLQLIQQHKPNLALLDLMLPGIDGLEICRQVRANSEIAQTPIIMLTAKSEESDIVLGLGIGADDYISKPFSPRELIARIKAMLRRDQSNVAPQKNSITINGLTINSHKFKVTFNGEKIKLTATEFRLLEYLSKHPGQVFSREQIMNNAYGSDVVVVDRNIDVHVRSIRKKIGEEHQFIETIRGVGYSFIDKPI
jgi:DNA-binding response OmpR family regulator